MEMKFLISYVLFIYTSAIVINTIMFTTFTDFCAFAVCYFCRHQVAYGEDAIYEDFKMNIENK